MLPGEEIQAVSPPHRAAFPLCVLRLTACENPGRGSRAVERACPRSPPCARCRDERHAVWPEVLPVCTEETKTPAAGRRSAARLRAAGKPPVAEHGTERRIVHRGAGVGTRAALQKRVTGSRRSARRGSFGPGGRGGVRSVPLLATSPCGISVPVNVTMYDAGGRLFYFAYDGETAKVTGSGPATVHRLARKLWGISARRPAPSVRRNAVLRRRRGAVAKHRLGRRHHRSVSGLRRQPLGVQRRTPFLQRGRRPRPTVADQWHRRRHADGYGLSAPRDGPGEALRIGADFTFAGSGYASDGSYHSGLWKGDGTAGGTAPIQGPERPAWGAVLDGKAYYLAGDQLWEADAGGVRRYFVDHGGAELSLGHLHRRPPGCTLSPPTRRMETNCGSWKAGPSASSRTSSPVPAQPIRIS